MSGLTNAQRAAIRRLNQLRIPPHAYGASFIARMRDVLLDGRADALARNADDMLWDLCHRYRRQFSTSPLLAERVAAWHQVDERHDFWRGFMTAQARMANIGGDSFQRLDEIAAGVIRELAAPAPAFRQGVETALELRRRQGFAHQQRFARQREQNLRTIATLAGQVC